jgi:hypothetical protein
LRGGNDEAAASEDLKNAQTIYRQLAIEKKADAQHQIEWLEAELRAAFRETAESRMTHLKRIDEINRTLGDKWPADPAALYRLACYLMQTEPILLLPTERKALEAGPAATAPVEHPASD